MLELGMLTLSFTSDNRDRIITGSLSVLRNGGIIVYPTESFYALGVLATDEDVVRKLFEIKKRPVEKPLPLIVGDRETLKNIVKKIPDSANDLMRKYWPGPLTIIFEANDSVPEMITAGTGKVAVRVPGEGPALYLAKALKMPVTATSANLSSEPPADTPAAVMQYFRDSIGLMIDSGNLPGGKPSTIVDVTVCPPVILREGRIILSLEQMK